MFWVNHGQLFGTTRGGAEVDVCHHIPLCNCLTAFSYENGQCKTQTADCGLQTADQG